jgi:hypothetical protein
MELMMAVKSFVIKAQGDSKWKRTRERDYIQIERNLIKDKRLERKRDR